MTKRLLITGATGFIGRHVVAMAADDWEVHTDRVNLLDGDEAAGLIERVRPTHLIHLAWFVEPAAYWTSPANIEWADASAHLFRAFARRGGERIVGVGTSAELWSDTVYGASKKRLSEELAAIDMSSAWARLYLVYGPGEPHSRFIPKLIRARRTGEVVPCAKGVARDFIYVRDVAAALLAIAASEVRGFLSIGTGVATPLCEVASRIGAPHEAVELEGETPVVVADVTRLRDEVGFVPKYTLEQGLAETIASV